MKGLKLNKKQISLLVSGVCLTTSIIGNIIISDKNNKKEELNCIGNLYQSINTNDELNNYEKMILDNSINFLIDYQEYLDYDYVCSMLDKLKVEYNNKNIYSEKENKLVVDNTIDKNNIYKDKEANIEFIKLLSKHNDKYPQVLKDGISSLICEEYNMCDKTLLGQNLIIKMLCEIVNPEIIIKSFFEGDFSLIEKELLKIDNNKDNLNNLEELFDKYNYYFYQEESNELNQVKTNIVSSLSNYYEIKSGRFIDTESFLKHVNLHESMCEDKTEAYSYVTLENYDILSNYYMYALLNSTKYDSKEQRYLFDTSYINKQKEGTIIIDRLFGEEIHLNENKEVESAGKGYGL